MQSYLIITDNILPDDYLLVGTKYVLTVKLAIEHYNNWHNDFEIKAAKYPRKHGEHQLIGYINNNNTFFQLITGSKVIVPRIMLTPMKPYITFIGDLN